MPQALGDGLPGSASGKEPTCQCKRDVSFISGSERSPAGEHGNALQDSHLRILWAEERGGLQSVVLQRVGHD